MTERTTHVILCDNHRSRRKLLARMFRTAGCFVREAAHEDEVRRALSDRAHSWVLAIADRVLSARFCSEYPGVPVIRIGEDHRATLSGRFSIAGHPLLSAHAHATVGSRLGDSRC